MSLPLMILSCAALAQDAHATKPQGHAAQPVDAMHRYASLDEIVGSEVQLAPSAEERRDAAQSGDEPDRPNGSIDDLVLQPDGKIGWAALSVGGMLGIGDKVVLVPADRIRHVTTEDGMQCRLNLTEAELEALPAFDAKEAKKEGRLESQVRAVDASFKGGTTAQDALAKDAKGMPAGGLVLASTLLDLDVRGSDDKFGDVSDAVVDTSSNCVDYVIVSHGGAMGIGDSKFLLPLQAARVGMHDEDRVLMVDRPVAQLEKGVRYEEPKDGFVNADALQRVDADFKVLRDRRKDMQDGMTGRERPANNG